MDYPTINEAVQRVDHAIQTGQRVDAAMPPETMRKTSESSRFRDAVKTSMASMVTGMDQCDDHYHCFCVVLRELLSGAEYEVLAQLVTQGPVWDGDIVSKTSRDVLLMLGLASRACVKGETGYTVANYRGGDVWRTLRA